MLNLARLDEMMQKGHIETLINNLAKFSEKLAVLDAAKGMFGEWSKQYGPAIIFKRLWDNLGLASILQKALEKTGIEFDCLNAVFAMVLNRLSAPCSKRAVTQWIKDIYAPDFDNLKLHHYYRALDFLADHKEYIENELFSKERNLFNTEVDLMFFDTTSVFFYGQGPEELARRGYSKDHRPDCLQFMLGLLVTKEGKPIAHEIFPGNCSDKEAFKKMIEVCKKRFNIRRIILVADRGMISREIRDILEKHEYEYILGCKMRNTVAVKHYVLSQPGPFTKVSDSLEVLEVKHLDNRYIVCFNPKEAAKQKEDRKAIIEQLKQKLQSDAKSLIGNKGYAKYLKKLEKNAFIIDEEKIREEERYDGKYVLITNTDLPASEVALAYKGLYKIERAFRELKSELDIRPLYHYTDKRVRGHVMVCFLAYLLEVEFSANLKRIGAKGSFTEVMNDLSRLRITRLLVNGKPFLVRTRFEGTTHEAFRAVGMQIPPEVILST